MVMDSEAAKARKRRHSPELIAEDESPLLITGPPHAGTHAGSESAEREEKKARLTQDSNQSTPLLLAHLQGTYIPLDTDVSSTGALAQPNAVVATPPAPEDENGWVKRQFGVQLLMYNEELNAWRCPCCGLRRPTPNGVAVHLARYCTKNPCSSARVEIVDIDEVSQTENVVVIKKEEDVDDDSTSQ